MERSYIPKKEESHPDIIMTITKKRLQYILDMYLNPDYFGVTEEKEQFSKVMTHLKESILRNLEIYGEVKLEPVVFDIKE